MKSGSPYLVTKNLAVGYVHKRAENRLFENLDLTLRGGELVCFMGPNGAGKSSLLRTLAGLHQPLSGKVELIPTDSKHNSAQLISVVLTDRVNTLNLTVEEIISFGRYPYLGWNIRLSAADRSIIQASIEQVRLQQLLGRKVYELSDGQLQMVMIARALAQDTPIILLDEPTAHLDLNNRLEIMNLLRDLSRHTGKAILVATHELDLALQTADLIWLTGKNRDILSGLPEDLVLNGSFDEIFRFKGFDLKSGKVQQRPYRDKTLQLKGEGPALLWTKNALERNGFLVSQEEQETSISLVQHEADLKWIVKKNNFVREVDSIQKVVELL
jgi:iron complex transport system ATP-binding protein